MKTSMHFLNRDGKFDHEKPFSYKFPQEGFQATNMTHHKVEGIQITDMRGQEAAFTLDKNGFAVLNVDCSLARDDYYNEGKCQAYLRNMETVLAKYLEAGTVKVFRSCIRKRDKSFPLSTGEAYDWDQPATTAHIDATPEEAFEEVKRFCPEEADSLEEKRVQWINFWSPLRGPVNDYPLMLCDASTVDPERDLEVADFIYPEYVTENTHVYYNSNYKWFYLSDHQPNEVIVFTQADSSETSLPGVVHASGPNPLAPPDELPRESLEARAFVFYD